MTTVKITSIHYKDGLLCWDADAPLATREQYELGDRCVGSIFEALKPREIVELAESLFVLDDELDLVFYVADFYSTYLSAAYNYGKQLHPDAPKEHHAAYANSVACLITGMSSGFGGPSCREHAVTWALSGPNGKQCQVETNIGTLVMQYPDGSLKSSGQWKYEEALAFAEPYCYGELTPLHYKCYEWEKCFDDSESDIEALKKPSVSSESP